MKKYYYMLIVMLPAIISIIILSCVSFYSTGVIDRSSAKSIISERIEFICKDIDEKKELSENITKEIYNNYCSKARAVSMMLSKNRDVITDEASFEEMRVAIGADVISITDKNGVIIYSTDMSVEETYALEEFMPAIDDKVFSKAVISEYNNNSMIIAGSSRLDEDGIIQIHFSIKNYEQQLNMSEISTAVTHLPLMKSGDFAVIDESKKIFISHTDSRLNGTAVQFPFEKFKKDDGSFSSRYNGEKVLVKYKKHDGYIVAGILPYSEIYQRRTTVVWWILISAAIIVIVITLTLRDFNLRKQSNKK